MSSFEDIFRSEMRYGRDRHYILAERLEHLIRHFNTLISAMERLMATFDELTAKVARNTDVVNSALTLIQGLADAIKNAGVDPAKLDTLVAQLNASDDALAAAIVANTPTAPSP